MSNRTRFFNNQPIRPPGLILRLRSGQAPGVCLSINSRPRAQPRGSGLILSGVFLLRFKNRGFGAVERINSLFHKKGADSNRKKLRMEPHGQSACPHAEVPACGRQALRHAGVVPPCSSAESAEAYPPTHKASEGYPLRIHPRP
jgi:hypothetical protein